jgi:hypothetical protein
MINDTTQTDYQPDVRLLCERLNIGHHQLVIVMSELCRLTKQSPREMLVTLEGVDDITEYATSVKFDSLDDNQPYFDEFESHFE